MERKKGKSVSWASPPNLLKVKYFQRTDRPSKVGQKTSDHLKLDASNPHHVVSGGSSSNMYLQIPQVHWRTPPEFVLRSNWLVAAGEESEEIEVQKHREHGVLEAVYPRASAIPPSPLISLDVVDQLCDDTQTPSIPIIPIEEITAAGLSSSETAPPNIYTGSPPKNLLQGPSTSATPNIPPQRCVSSPEPSNKGKSAPAIPYSLEGDPVIATVIAANAILNSENLGSLIDTDLLIQFLKDPETTRKLINEYLLSSSSGSGTTESKVFTCSVPPPCSQLPADKSGNEHSKPADAGPEAIERPLRTKLSSLGDAKIGKESGPNSIQSEISMLRSTNSLLIKSPNGNNQSANKGNIDARQMPKQMHADDAFRETGSRTKEVMPPVSHRSSTCDLLSKKSIQSEPVSGRSQIVKDPEHLIATNLRPSACSQPKEEKLSVPLLTSTPDFPSKELTNIGSLAMPKPLIDETVAGSASNKARPSVSLPISVHDLLGKKFSDEHSEQANTGNVGFSKPVVMQFIGANTGIGAGYRNKMVQPPISLQTPFSETLDSTSGNKQNHPDRMENVAVPRPLMQSIAVNAMSKTAFSPMAFTSPVPFPSSVPDFQSNKPANEPRQLSNAVAGLMAENQPFRVSRINVDFPGAARNSGSFPVARPINLTGPILEKSRLKKLIDEHGSHVQGGDAPVAGSREHRQPHQLLSAAFSASSFSAPITPEVKDMKHYPFSIKQHNGNHELLLQNKPQNYFQGSEAAEDAQVMKCEPKFQKPCLFYNTRKGCRNGSRCSFQHDPSKQWRSGDALDAPQGKKLKPGEELGGRR